MSAATSYSTHTILLLFSCSAVSSSSWPHELQHTRVLSPPLSLGVCSNSCPLSQWYHLTISSSVSPFSSCPQSFPASGSFPMSHLFASGGQSIGASTSASVLPMNIQAWFPWGLSSLISLLSKGLSKISSQALSLLYGPALTSVHDYWKNHSFDYMDLCWLSDVSPFLICYLGLPSSFLRST